MTPPPSAITELEEVKGQLRLARARRDLRRLESQSRLEAWSEARLTESYYGFTGPDFGAFVDPNDAFRDPDLRGFGSPLLPAGAGRYDRQDGRNRPFIWWDIDLDWMRSQSRWIATRNPLGAGILRRLTNFAIRKGFTYEVRPREEFSKDRPTRDLAGQVDSFLVEFRHTNAWPRRERSAFLRSRRDGDALVRHFAQPDGMTLVRFVEPEQLRQPLGSPIEWTFGVHTAHDDIEHVLGYAVAYGNPEDWTEVPAEDVAHLKLNVDECVKRGISDFFSTGAAVEETWKLLRNLRVVSTVQAAVPWIEEFENASQTQVSAYIDSKKDQNRPVVTNPITGRTPNLRRYEPGEIPHIGRGRKYIDQPSAANAPNHVAVVQAGLRAIGARWDMTESMVSGDASNNNMASQLIAGSPFVTGIECEQADYEAFFLRSQWIAVRNAARAGRFSMNGRRVGEQEIARRLDIHATPPQVAIANKREEAEVDHRDIAAGVMSIQTRRAKVGLKDEQERENLKEEPPRKPQGPPQGADAAGGGQGAFQGPSGRWFTRNGEGRTVPTHHESEQTPAPLPEALDPADVAEWMLALEESARRQNGDEWTTNGRRYRRENGRTIRLPGRGQPPAGSPPPASAQQQPATPVSRRQHVEAARARVQELLRRLSGLGDQRTPLTAQDFEDLSSGLSLLTIPQLRAARQRLAARFGGARRHEEMVQALRSHVQGLVAAHDPGEATFIPDPEPPAPAPAPRPSAAPTRTPDALAAAIGRGELADRASLQSALATLPLQGQQAVRQLVGLPFSHARALITDPHQYAAALAQAIIDHRAHPPAPAAAAPPAAPAPAAAPSIPSIAGRATDPPQLPTRASVGGSRNLADYVLGRTVAPELLAACSNAYDGCTTRVVSGHGNHFTMRTSGQGVTATRTFTRHRDGKVEVHNDYFTLDDHSPFKGEGISLFLNQVRALRAAGVDYITTHAAGNFTMANSGGFNGYITWPKFGYDGTMQESAFRRLPPEMQAKLGQKRNVQSLLALPGGVEAWELYGSDILDGRFDLHDGSDSMSRLDAYLDKRRSQGRSQPRPPAGQLPQQRQAARRAELEQLIRQKIATWSR